MESTLVAVVDDELAVRVAPSRLLRLAGCEVVMLAQFSMAAAQPAVQAALPCPVLSSPYCAVLALQKRMHHV